MTAPEEYTRQQAADPSTPQQVLADIAALREDLRPVVALNPAAYPGLLHWLASLGEPGVDTALAQRRAQEAGAAGAQLAGGGSDGVPPWTAPEAVPGPARATLPVPGGGPFATSAPGVGGGATGYPVPAYGGGAGFPGPGGPGGPGYSPGGFHGAGQSGFPPPGSGTGSRSRTGLWIVLGVLGALLVAGVVVVLVVVNLARGVADDLEEQGFDLGPTLEGETYGDNPELDALWDACAADDMQACDDLYFDSPGGSAYEDFGDTCGGRTDGGTLCASGEPGEPGASGTPETYGDDPALDALWDACASGDLAACDELYFSSGIGTEYEEFGETCGRTQDGFGLCAP